MSEEATQQAAQQSSPQPKMEPALIFVITNSEAEILIRGLDELPGKESRPLTQKLSIQAQLQQQLQLIADIAAHYETLPPENKLAPSTAAAPVNEAPPPSKVRKIK